MTGTSQTPPLNVDGKRVLVTGGTGSLGRRVVRRLLEGAVGRPRHVVVLSRDEAKTARHAPAVPAAAGGDRRVIYRNFARLLRFRIGDVATTRRSSRRWRRTSWCTPRALAGCLPAVLSHGGRPHVCSADAGARRAHQRPPRGSGGGISTDKACKPVNVMGMTKALMERVLVERTSDRRARGSWASATAT